MNTDLSSTQALSMMIKHNAIANANDAGVSYTPEQVRLATDVGLPPNGLPHQRLTYNFPPLLHNQRRPHGRLVNLNPIDPSNSHWHNVPRHHHTLPRLNEPTSSPMEVDPPTYPQIIDRAFSHASPPVSPRQRIRNRGPLNMDFCDLPASTRVQKHARKLPKLSIPPATTNWDIFDATLEACKDLPDYHSDLPTPPVQRTIKRVHNNFCPICHTVDTGMIPFMAHLHSARHTKALKVYKEAPCLRLEDGRYYCAPCGMMIDNYDNVKHHVASAAHQTTKFLVMHFADPDVLEKMLEVHEVSTAPPPFPQFPTATHEGDESSVSAIPEINTTNLGTSEFVTTTEVVREQLYAHVPGTSNNTGAPTNLIENMNKELIYFQGTWDLTAKSGDVLYRAYLPGDFFNDNLNAHYNTVQLFQFGRFDQHLRIQLNGNKFSQGQLGIIVYPPGISEWYNKSSNVNTLAQKTQPPSLKTLMANSTAEVSIDVPWLSPRDYYAIHDVYTERPDPRILYVLEIFVINPLLVGTTASSTMSYTIWSSFPNAIFRQLGQVLPVAFPQFNVPSEKTAKRLAKLIMLKDSQYAITLFTRVAARIPPKPHERIYYDMLASLPEKYFTAALSLPVLKHEGFNLETVVKLPGRIFDTIMKGVGIVGDIAEGVGSVLGFIGLDNPHVFENDTQVQLVVGEGWNHGSGIQHGHMLTLNPGIYAQVPPHVIPVDAAFSNLLQLAKMETLVYQTTWATTQADNTVLYTKAVSPVFVTPPTDPTHPWTMPWIQFVAQNYRYFTGSIKFRVQVVGAAYQTGRLLLIHSPGKTTNTFTKGDSTNFVYTSMDFQGGTNEYIFVCAQIAELPIQDLNDIAGDALASIIGQFQIVVQNRLCAPSSVPQSVYINIFASAGDDFQVGFFQPAQVYQPVMSKTWAKIPVASHESLGEGIVPLNRCRELKDVIQYHCGEQETNLGLIIKRVYPGGVRPIARPLVVPGQNYLAGNWISYNPVLPDFSALSPTEDALLIPIDDQTLGLQTQFPASEAALITSVFAYRRGEWHLKTMLPALANGIAYMGPDTSRNGNYTSLGKNLQCRFGTNQGTGRGVVPVVGRLQPLLELTVPWKQRAHISRGHFPTETNNAVDEAHFFSVFTDAGTSFSGTKTDIENEIDHWNSGNARIFSSLGDSFVVCAPVCVPAWPWNPVETHYPLASHEGDEQPTTRLPSLNCNGVDSSPLRPLDTTARLAQLRSDLNEPSTNPEHFAINFEAKKEGLLDALQGIHESCFGKKLTTDDLKPATETISEPINAIKETILENLPRPTTFVEQVIGAAGEQTRKEVGATLEQLREAIPEASAAGAETKKYLLDFVEGLELPTAGDLAGSAAMEMTNIVMHIMNIIDSNSISDFMWNIFHALMGTTIGKRIATEIFSLLRSGMTSVIEAIQGLQKVHQSTPTHEGDGDTFDRFPKLSGEILTGIIGLVSLFFLGHKASMINKASMLGSLLTTTRFAGQLATAAMNITRFIPWLVSVLSWIWDNLPYFGTKDSLKNEGEEGERMLRFMDKVEELAFRVGDKHEAFDETLHNDILKLYDEGEEIRSWIITEKKTKYWMYFKPTHNILVEMTNAALAVKRNRPFKFDPMCVCFTGDAGVGKSMFANVFVNDVAHIAGYPVFNRTFVRSDEDEYWTGYTGQPFTLIDDFNSSTQSKTVPEFIKTKSNVGMPLNMAAINEKGYHFSSHMLVLTTNQAYPAPNEIYCREALWRRRNMLVEVRSNPACSVNGKVPAKQIDLVRFSHSQFRLLDPIHEQGVLSEWVSYEQFLARAVHDFTSHIQFQTAILKTYGQPSVIAHEYKDKALPHELPKPAEGERGPSVFKPPKPFVRDHPTTVRRRVKYEGFGDDVPEGEVLYCEMIKTYKGPPIPAHLVYWNSETRKYCHDITGPLLQQLKKIFKQNGITFDHFMETWLTDDCCEYLQTIDLPFDDEDLDTRKGEPQCAGSSAELDTILEEVVPTEPVETIPKVVETEEEERLRIWRATRNQVPIFDETVPPKMPDFRTAQPHDWQNWNIHNIVHSEWKETQRRAAPKFTLEVCAFRNDIGLRIPLSSIKYDGVTHEFGFSDSASPETIQEVADYLEIEGVKFNDFLVNDLTEQSKQALQGAAIHPVNLSDIMGEDIFQPLRDKFERAKKVYTKFVHRLKIRIRNAKNWVRAHMLPLAAIVTTVATVGVAFWMNRKRKDAKTREQLAKFGLAYEGGEIARQGTASPYYATDNRTPGKKIVHLEGDQKLTNVRQKVNKGVKVITAFRPAPEGNFFQTTANVWQFAGPYALVNKHIVRDAVVMSVHQAGIEYTFPLNEKNLYRHPSKDLAVIIFPPQIAPCPSMLNHLVQNCDLPNIMRTAAQLVSRRGGELIIQSGAMRVSDITNIDGTFFRGLYCMDANTSKGDCGAPIILSEPKFVRKICAIHTAGDGEHSYSEPITLELVTKMIKELGKIRNIPNDIANVMGPENPECFLEGDEEPVFQPEGNFTVLGKVPARLRPGRSNKTAYRASPIHGVAFPVLSRPPLMPKEARDLGIPDTFKKSVEKYGKPPSVFPKQDVEAVIAYTTERILRDVRPQRVPQKLTWEQTLQGIDGIEYYDRMNLSSSPGYPHILEHRGNGKRGFVDGAKDTWDESLQTELTEMDEQLQRGETPLFLWMDCEKDERLLNEKVYKGKIRVFTVGNLPFTILMRRYFLDFFASFYAAHRVPGFFSAVGIDCTGPEWTKLWSELRGKSSEGFDGDHGQYDGDLLLEYNLGVVQTINAWYDKYCPTNTPGDNLARQVIGMTLVHTTQIARDCAYVTHKGHPSGQAGTVIWNTIVNFEYFCTAWRGLARKHCKAMIPFHQFEENVGIKVYGDDNANAVKQEVSNWFNLEECSEFFAGYGMSYGSARKDGSSYTVQPLDQCTFLKQGWRCDERYQGLIHPLMCESTITELTNWIKVSPDAEEAFRMNVLDSCNFAYHYGNTWYSDFRTTLATAMEDTGRNFTLPQWHELDDVWLAKFDM